MEAKTVRESPAVSAEQLEPLPGLVLVFAVDRPAWGVLPLGEGETIELGRGEVAGVVLDDVKVSRRHASVTRNRAGWSVRDLGSTNGTFLDGAPTRGEITVSGSGVVRVGGTVFLRLDDIRPFLGHSTRVLDGVVVGSTLAAAHKAIARAASAGDGVFLRGESGSGKEVAARFFHQVGPRPRGPFIPVNCASIPHGLAERLLFGAKKGAYSGADSDVEGYFQAADGGTLFLDEVAELESEVQAKLLRVLETKEVLQLGATKPRAVDVRVCSATHADLRARVADGRFRQDLYFRIARPEIAIPPLVERLEEVAFHASLQAERSVQDAGLSVDATLVEFCLLRPWPGNIRELVAEVKRAALMAHSEGRAIVLATDLQPNAGVALNASPMPSAVLPKDEIAEALRLEGGNVSRAAARLGIHRNRIRRWMEQRGLDRRSFTGEE